MLRLQLQGEAVRCFFPVILCMPSLISTTTYDSADQADPEIFRAVADPAKIRGITPKWLCGRLGSITLRGVRVPAYGTARSLPVLEARAVEDMLAWYRHQAGGIVHTLQAHWTSRELNEVRRRRRERLQTT